MSIFSIWKSTLHNPTLIFLGVSNSEIQRNCLSQPNCGRVFTILLYWCRRFQWWWGNNYLPHLHCVPLEWCKTCLCDRDRHRLILGSYIRAHFPQEDETRHDRARSHQFHHLIEPSDDLGLDQAFQFLASGHECDLLFAQCPLTMLFVLELSSLSTLITFDWGIQVST